jgi:hypothetical protein
MQGSFDAVVIKSSNTIIFLTVGSRYESFSKSSGIPCSNSTLGHTVVFISSYIGCHLLYNHIILSGTGLHKFLTFCNIFLTWYVLPQDDGPLRIAMNECRKTKAYSLLIIYGDCSVSTPICGGGGGGIFPSCGGGGIFPSCGGGGGISPSCGGGGRVYSPPTAAVADTHECSADMDG